MDPSSPLLPVALPRPDVRLRSTRKPRRLHAKSAALGHVHTATCPQCGIGDATVPVDEELTHVPGWVYVLLLVNVLIMAIAAVAARKQVRMRYRLCVECTDARRHARVIRFMGSVGVIMLPMLFAAVSVGLGLSLPEITLATSTGIVAGIVGRIAAFRRTRLDVIALAGLDTQRGIAEIDAPDSFYKVLEDEAPQALPSST